MQCQRSRQEPEEAERDGTQACALSHDRKPDTQPRDGYQHCHSLHFLSPTMSPPQPRTHTTPHNLAALILTHSRSSSYRKCVIEIEVEEGLERAVLLALHHFATFAQVRITITVLNRESGGWPQWHFLSNDLEDSP